jgi:hypothetical protein
MIHRSKIKCRGEKPSCSSCSRRGVPCIYDRRLNRNVVQPTQTDDHFDVIAPEVDLGQPSEPSIPIFPDVFIPVLDSQIDMNLDWLFSDTFNNVALAQPFATNEEQPIPSSVFDVPSSLSLSTLPGSARRNSGGPDAPWPMAWNATPIQSFNLPPLGSQENYIKGPTYFSLTPISASTRTTLLNYLRLALENALWQNVSLDAFPSQEKLDHCVDMFFAHFDRVRHPMLEMDVDAEIVI